MDDRTDVRSRLDLHNISIDVAADGDVVLVADRGGRFGELVGVEVLGDSDGCFTRPG